MLSLIVKKNLATAISCENSCNNFRAYQDFLHPTSMQPPRLVPAGAPAISTSIIPANYSEGSKMDLTDFCKIFTIVDSIKQCLQDNTIMETQSADSRQKSTTTHSSAAHFSMRSWLNTKCGPSARTKQISEWKVSIPIVLKAA